MQYTRSNEQKRFDRTALTHTGKENEIIES